MRKFTEQTCMTAVPRRPRFMQRADGTYPKTFAQALRPAAVTSFVGGGGKTSTMLALALELCAQGARVIVTTTTHILPVSGEIPGNLRIAGTPLPNGKLGSVDRPGELKKECDFLLVEADGSRSLPAKAPAKHEPALLPETEMVIAVQGMTAFGKPIAQACHRPERVCAVLGKKASDILLPKDGARLLLSAQGQRKDVGGRRYAVVLNQADSPKEVELAKAVAAHLPEELCCLFTAYDTGGGI